MKAHELTSPFNEDEEIDWSGAWKEPSTLILVGTFILFIILSLVF